MNDYLIRAAKPAEAGLFADWAAVEGWNPGLHDMSAFYGSDPEGFLLGERQGEPVGIISAVAYGKTFGFVGFYIVKPEYRGRGYGLALWQAAMARLGTRNIGLDGVVAQQDNYHKSGFHLAYRNIRYEGRAVAHPPVETVDLKQVPLSAIAAYDASLFPAPRDTFLKPWVQEPAHVVLGLLDNGNLAAYGVLRPCRQGFKIGPLFANTEQQAEKLFQALTSRVAGQLVYLDVPEPNKAALNLAERHGMTPRFETARMYTRTAPSIPLELVFGNTTFELG